MLGKDLGPPLFSFALFGDTQYGNMKPSGMRYYKLSKAKMAEMAAFLREREQIDFLVHLGDLTQDKGSAHRSFLLDELKSLPKTHHVLGNHDFKGVKSIKEVLSGFGLSSRHYIIDEPKIGKSGYEFIVVDATEVSTFGADKGSAEYNAAVELSGRLKRSREKHWETHNGGVGRAQREWLDTTLAAACARNRSVILFSHSPLLTGARNNDMHTWDRNELLEIISKRRCAKLWVAGHVHVHRHVTYNVDPGHFVHLWTTSGMVQTPNNSFVVVDVHPEQLLLRGVSWGTSFCKFYNLSGDTTTPGAPPRDLGSQGYDYNFSSHYLTRTHLSSVRGGFDADIAELGDTWTQHTNKIPAVTFQPDGTMGEPLPTVRISELPTETKKMEREMEEVDPKVKEGGGGGDAVLTQVNPNQILPIGDSSGAAFVHMGVTAMMVPILIMLWLLKKRRVPYIRASGL